MRHRIAAGAIIEDDDERLLLLRHRVQDHHDFWMPPGGGAEIDEPLREAARREVCEETGLDVRVGPLAYIEERFDSEHRACKFWFLAERIGGQLGVSKEVDSADGIIELAWLKRSDLVARTVYPSSLVARYWEDRLNGFPHPIYLGLFPFESSPS